MHARPTDASHAGRIDRRWWAMIAIGWAGFVACGSWYPFQFHSGTLADAWHEWWNSGAWSDQATTDLAVNLLLGIPLGFFGTLAAQPGTPLSRRNGAPRFTAFQAGRWLSALLVVVAVAAWGVLVELGQHWYGERVVSRVVSRADSAAQALGGLLGTVVACWGGAWMSGRVFSVVGRQTRRSRLGAMLDLYVAGYVVWMLMPFIPAISPSELAAKWKSGGLRLAIYADWQAQPLQVAYSLAVSGATACPLGIWLAGRLKGSGDRLQRATAAAIAAFLAVALEISQAFIETRTAALDDAIGSAVGAASGAWAVGWLFPTLPVGRTRPLEATPLLAVGTLLYAMLYVLEAWAPFDFIDSSEALQSRLRELGPQTLTGLLGGDDLTHVSNLLRLIFLSAPLGALAGLTAKSVRLKWFAWGVATAVCCAVCLLAEGGQIMSQTRFPSLADLAVRLLGCLAGGWLCLRIFRRW